jgi:hypothetical protein
MQMFNPAVINVIKRPKTGAVNAPIYYICSNVGVFSVLLPFYCL